MAKPAKVWYVEVLPGGTPLKYRERGGGHFTSEAHAANRLEGLLRQGVNAKMFVTETEWKEVW